MRISLDEAKIQIQRRVTALPWRAYPLMEALGCITAKAVFAPIDQPPFPRSPLDGYALQAADTEGASRETPAWLAVVGASYAGHPSNVRVHSGEAVRIMTGGAIPEGADCVIMQESTDLGEMSVRVYRAVKPDDNFCHRGEDFTAGDELIAAGIPVTAAVVAVAASAGLTTLDVYPKPRVALLSTGDELIPPGTPLANGCIYGSNEFLLRSYLQELGIGSVACRAVRDELAALEQAFLDAASQCDLMISTGGVSVGQRDLVPKTLECLGAETVFHGVAIKPGMPATFAMLGRTPILALSGNPFAAAASFELLARPALSVLACDAGLNCKTGTAVLAKDYKKKSVVPRFLRGIYDGTTVRVPDNQGNGQIRTLIGCNCLAELPVGEGTEAGTVVRIYRLGKSVYASESACDQRL